MKYNFDEIVNRRGTNSVKWDGGKFLKKLGFTERYDDETLPLFTADMDLPVPQPVIDALHAQLIIESLVIPFFRMSILKRFSIGLRRDMIGNSKRRNHL